MKKKAKHEKVRSRVFEEFDSHFRTRKKIKLNDYQPKRLRPSDVYLDEED